MRNFALKVDDIHEIVLNFYGSGKIICLFNPGLLPHNCKWSDSYFILTRPSGICSKQYVKQESEHTVN